MNTEDTPRKTCDQVRRGNEDRLRRLVDILQHPSDTIQEFLDYALKQAIELTECRIGYIYHYSEETGEFVLNTWSEEVMEACQVEKQETTYQLDKTGIWGEAVRQRRPIVINDFSEENPLKKGCPKGHVVMTNFLTIPIFKHKKIVGVVGLANKEMDFDETDILNITLLMEAVWTVIESKKAEQALSESNARYDKLVQRISVGIYTMRSKSSGETQFKYCSAKFCEMLGLTAAGVLTNTESVDQAIHPDDRASLSAANQQAVKCGQSFRWEGRSLVQGKTHWIRFESEPTPLPNGDSLWNGVLFDISERKQAEEKLKESEERFKALHNASFGGIAIHDQGVILECNQGLSEMTQYATEELIGMDGLLLLAPEYRELVGKNIANGYEKSYEAFGKRKNGELFPMQLEARNIPYKGKIVRVVEFRDITEKKQAEEQLNQASTRLALATRAGRVGVWDWSIATNTILFDDQMLELYGLKWKDYEINYDTWRSAIHPEDKNRVDLEMQMAIQGKKEFDTEFRVVWPDDSIHTIRALATVQWGDSGTTLRMIGTNWDITEQKKLFARTLESNRLLQAEITERMKSEEALRVSEEKLQTIIETSPDGIAISALDGTVEFVTTKSITMWGYDSAQEIIGKNVIDFIHPSYREKAIYNISEMLNGRLTGATEYLMLRKDGSLFYSEVNANIFRDDNKNPIGFLYVERDITERKQLEEELQELAIKDQLTGLYNRRKIDEVLVKEKLMADRRDQDLAIIMADIDMFKLVNDQHGHLVGDKVLTAVTEILSHSIRKNDILGRWGGEEFMIICPGTDLAGATILAEKIREMVAAHNFGDVGRKTCSFGVAQLRKEETIDELLYRSDQALYRAKERGRNRVEQEVCKDIPVRQTNSLQKKTRG